MAKIAMSYKKNLDVDDIESIKNFTLWRVLCNFNPIKGVKFTTYLANSLKKGLYKAYLKKKQLVNNYENFDKSYENDYTMTDIIMSLDGIDKELMDLRFVKMMTFNEISEKTGISSKLVCKKIKKIINRFKH